ncbi:hypothetical protein C0581_03065 [Candidatus Parcubacteria bacterium]|nr:MAG: hypothetical protein C0581_03065 [Candidatus Parcubacteria bacterium]
MLIDSHCHIQLKGYKDDREDVLLRCRKKDVIMNAVGTQKDTSKKAVKISEDNENIYATIGLHPNHLFPMEINGDDYDFVAKAEDFDEDFYRDLVKSKKVIGIGECGIDLFHLPKDVSKEEVLKRQKEIFVKQAIFAKQHDLPLVIHTRDEKKQKDGSLGMSAHDELIQTLGGLEGARGVVHCYTSDWEHAQKYLGMGLYLGFTGVITFPAKKTDPKPQEDLLEVVKKCPLDRILIETDAPYLAPQKYRGKKCEPWMVEEVVKKIAEIKEKDLETVKKQVLLNTKELFTRIN